MVDLILPRRPRTPSNPKKPTTAKTETGATAPRQRLPAPSDANIVAKVSSTIRSANDLLLYWKDGLTAEERALLRKKEERKQILSLRMKNVCWHLYVLLLYPLFAIRFSLAWPFANHAVSM